MASSSTNSTDGFDTEKYEAGYRWTYQSEGGAFYTHPKFYNSRASALRAGRLWLAKQRKQART